MFLLLHLSPWGTASLRYHAITNGRNPACWISGGHHHARLLSFIHPHWSHSVYGPLGHTGFRCILYSVAALS